MSWYLIFCDDNFMLNISYTGVIKSDVLLHSQMNFSALLYDSIVNANSLYHFFFEIYVCLFSNLIWKKVISILVKSWSDCNNFILFRKKLSRNFIKLTWDPAEKLVKCLNSAIFIEFFDYIFLKFTKCDYKTFLRFYSDNKEKK